MNAANEEAVAAFLDGRIGFLDIAEVVETVLDDHASTDPGAPNDLEDVLAADVWARTRAHEQLVARSR